MIGINLRIHAVILFISLGMASCGNENIEEISVFYFGKELSIGSSIETVRSEFKLSNFDYYGDCNCVNYRNFENVKISDTISIQVSSTFYFQEGLLLGVRSRGKYFSSEFRDQVENNLKNSLDEFFNNEDYEVIGDSKYESKNLMVNVKWDRSKIAEESIEINYFTKSEVFCCINN
jgi:hypothetical protein